jgi:flagellar hook-associated protein 2
MSTSATSAASSSSNPATFTGSSAFTAQLAQVIANAVANASIPMDNLETEQTTLQGQQSELQTLMSDFTSLGTALSNVDSSTGSSSYNATVSNTSVASATVSSGVLAGSYTLDVSNPGSQDTVMSGTTEGETTVTDPTQDNISSSTTFTLVVNGEDYTISDSDGTLDGLVNAINSSGANVQATVVNVGSNSSPDYRLTVQALDYNSNDNIQLLDPTNNNDNLLSVTLAAGADVEYTVNGQPASPNPPTQSTSRTLTLSPGLTVNVLGSGTATITVSQDGSSIENALSSFVTAYNAAMAEVNKNRGQAGGALTGDSSIFSLSEALNQIVNYQGSSGDITSMAAIGLTFDTNGNLDFDSSTFEQASSTDMTDVLNFLGSISGDNGFIGAANDILTGINDPTNGILAQENNTFTTEQTNLSSQISDDQSNITTLQQNLQNQMAAADAAIAALEQQASYMQMMFQTENANAQLGF